MIVVVGVGGSIWTIDGPLWTYGKMKVIAARGFHAGTRSTVHRDHFRADLLEAFQGALNRAATQAGELGDRIDARVTQAGGVAVKVRKGGEHEFLVGGGRLRLLQRPRGRFVAQWSGPLSSCLGFC